MKGGKGIRNFKLQNSISKGDNYRVKECKIYALNKLKSPSQLDTCIGNDDKG